MPRGRTGLRRAVRLVRTETLTGRTSTASARPTRVGDRRRALHACTHARTRANARAQNARTAANTQTFTLYEPLQSLQPLHRRDRRSATHNVAFAARWDGRGAPRRAAAPTAATHAGLTRCSRGTHAGPHAGLTRDSRGTHAGLTLRGATRGRRDGARRPGGAAATVSQRKLRTPKRAQLRRRR